MKSALIINGGDAAALAVQPTVATDSTSTFGQTQALELMMQQLQTPTQQQAMQPQQPAASQQQPMQALMMLQQMMQMQPQMSSQQPFAQPQMQQWGAQGWPGGQQQQRPGPVIEEIEPERPATTPTKCAFCGSTKHLIDKCTEMHKARKSHREQLQAAAAADAAAKAAAAADAAKK